MVLLSAGRQDAILKSSCTLVRSGFAVLPYLPASQNPSLCNSPV